MTASRVLRAGGLWFNGINSYVAIPHSDLFETGEFTILLWQYLVKAKTEFTLSVHKGWSYLRRGWGLLNKEWGPYHIDVALIWNFDGGVQHVIWIDNIYNKWIHIAAVYSERLNKAELWINGELKDTRSPITPYVKTTGGMELKGYGGWWGVKDEFRFYNRALSGDEIYEIYSKGTFIKDGLVLCLPFHEGEGNIAHDVSGYNNHGTIYGDPMWVVKKALVR